MDANRPPTAAMWSEWQARARTAKPFLKWAGGKQRFVYSHSHVLPPFHGKYLEPFLGGGAVFFHLARTQDRPFVARLGDVNKHLIRCYLAVRDQPEDVFNGLEVLQAGYSAASDKAAFYYEVRERHNARHPRDDASAFIFLNRTCWNGLWRINADGSFNVPYGAPKAEQVIPAREDLLAASAALANAHLRATPWENTLALAEPGDFVYLDPPYYSDYLLRETSTKYERVHFTREQHEQLALAVARLAGRGVLFVLTNSAEEEMLQLYRGLGLQTTEIGVARIINSKGDDRREVPELIVTSGLEQEPSNEAAVLLDLEARRLRARKRKSSQGSIGEG